MRKLLLTTLLAILTLVTGAQESQLEKPLLTLACISDVHTERSLIDCANLSDIALRGSFTRTVNLIKKNEQIDPGDMPVETPNIVQPLMVYVYTDRVELHMKNYNKSGTINGITVNKELAPYISYRKVKMPTGVKGAQLKDKHIEYIDVYDLLGRKMSNTGTKGIYITKNKKNSE